MFREGLCFYATSAVPQKDGAEGANYCSWKSGTRDLSLRPVFLVRFVKLWLGML